MHGWQVIGTTVVLLAMGTARAEPPRAGGPAATGGEPAAVRPAAKSQEDVPRIGALIEQVSALVPERSGQTVSAAVIVARVDEKVILLDDVVRPVRAKLEKAREQLSAAQYRQLEWELLKQVTEHQVQRMVVLKELETRLKRPDIMERVRKHAEKDFDKYLMRLAHEFGLKTREQVIERLEKEGSQLAELRADFVDNLIAQQYLREMVSAQIKEPTRDELYRYYQAHKIDYADEPGAVWRHIEIKKAPDASAARARSAAIERQLKDGADFATLAKEQSQGPTAVTGGLWSLTSPGSYADPAVDQALFALPIGTISPVIEGETSFHLIRVEKRSDGTPKSFTEVQGLIRGKIKTEQLDKLRKVKLDEMMGRHYVETIFDHPPAELKQTASP